MDDLIIFDQKAQDWLSLGGIMEPAIMTSCIFDTHTLWKMKNYIRYLRNQYIKSICQWCIVHYEEHGEAPGESVKQIIEETENEDIKWLYQSLFDLHLRKYKGPVNFDEVKTYLIKSHRFWEESE